MKNIVLYLLLIFASFQYSFAQNMQNDSFEKHPLLTDRFLINLGVFIPAKSIKLNVDGRTTNDVIDFAKDFNFNDNDVTFNFNFMWRFSKSKKWNVGIEYFALRSSKNAVLEKDITWEDRTYLAGANIEAGFGFNLYRLFFGRSISLGDKHEFFGGLGIHTLNINTYIEGDAYIDSNSVEVTLDRKKVDVIAPVPNIGLTYMVAASKKWLFIVRADWFSLKIKDYDGSLWNISPGVKFQFAKNFGAALNYKYFETKLDINKKQLNGGAQLIYRGPTLSLSGNF